MSVPDDRWAAGDAYEAYMGRWSRPLADRFVRWLGAETGLTWLDVGCGTGALTKAICELADPAAVVACDPSRPFVDHFASRISDRRVSAVVGGTGNLPDAPTGFDRVVSALVLNFVPDAREAVADMRARLRPGGVVAALVWDYARGMEFLRIFWDEAALRLVRGLLAAVPGWQRAGPGVRGVVDAGPARRAAIPSGAAADARPGLSISWLAPGV